MTNTSDWKTLEEQIKDIATNKLDDGWNTCALTRKQIQDILALIDQAYEEGKKDTIGRMEELLPRELWSPVKSYIGVIYAEIFSYKEAKP